MYLEMELSLVGAAMVGGNNFEFERDTKCVELNKILPSGSQSFPIQWLLPYDLISSYRWKGATVEYSFQAKIRYY
jgi:hypothetical protein